MPQQLPYPPGNTARRPDWTDLPTAVRRLIQDQLGSGVRRASSQNSGYTPGFASRLALADGSGAFVKAADEAHPWMVDAYREEADKLALLPDGVPAPTLRWRFDDRIDGRQWLILIFDEINGRPPARPWKPAQARAVLEAVTSTSRLLTPAPSDNPWRTFAENFADDALRWSRVPRVGIWERHGDAAAELAIQSLELCQGDSLVHADLRDDNLLLDDQGKVWICDWNYPITGPIWMDTLTCLLSMQGDGMDGDALLAASPLVQPHDRERIDAVLALLTGYWLSSAEQSPNVTSPYLRAHQRWYGEVCGAWLAKRRGWT